MEEPITRAEYEEYQKRIEDEDHRQNKRIEQLEENTKQINALTVSIEKVLCLWKVKTVRCGERSLVM